MSIRLLLSFSDVLLPREMVSFCLFPSSSFLPHRQSSDQVPPPWLDVFFSSSFYKTLLLVPLSLCYNVLSPCRPYNKVAPYSPFLPLGDDIALRFSPSRGCSRTSLSRARYAKATDVCSRAVLSSGYEISHHVLAALGCDEEKIYAVSSLHSSTTTVSRSSSLSQYSLRSFSDLSSLSDCLSLSVGRITDVRLSPPSVERLSCRRSRSYCKHVSSLFLVTIAALSSHASVCHHPRSCRGRIRYRLPRSLSSFLLSFRLHFCLCLCLLLFVRNTGDGKTQLQTRQRRLLSDRGRYEFASRIHARTHERTHRADAIQI